MTAREDKSRKCAKWNDDIQGWDFGWIVHSEDFVNHTAVISEVDFPAVRYVIDLDDIRG